MVYDQGILDESVFGYGVGAGLEFNYFFWGLFSDNLKSSIVDMAMLIYFLRF